MRLGSSQELSNSHSLPSARCAIRAGHSTPSDSTVVSRALGYAARTPASGSQRPAPAGKPRTGRVTAPALERVDGTGSTVRGTVLSLEGSGAPQLPRTMTAATSIRATPNMLEGQDRIITQQGSEE